LSGTNYLSIAEVQIFTGPSTPPVQWLISDHLGTPRMVLDQTGNPNSTRRHDYLPFGEELTAPTSGRSTAQGYTAGEGTRQQFTLKERDTETGLDYFLARYCSNLQGRFTSVDPDNAQARNNLSDPQGWNAYAYVGNKPLTKTDPDGRFSVFVDPEAWQRFRNWLYYERPITDAQLKKEVDKKREELKSQLRAMDGHEYSAEEFDSMGTGQVLKLYDRYRLGMDAGVAKVVPTSMPAAAGNVANVPPHVDQTLKQIEQTGGKAPPGYKGGRQFLNDTRGSGQSLPRTDAQGNRITYREYDVRPYQKGVNRGPERIVKGSDGSAYYSPDHYKTFTRIK
jgi:RHS repeat-associated protein